MAEVHFFMTHHDTRDFAQFLVDAFNATFTLDAQSTAELPVFTAADAVDRVVRSDEYAPRFFVLSPKWQRYALSVSETHHNDGRHLFYVDQRYGGPAFDFIVSREDEPSGFCIAGSFSDYPWYYLRRNDQERFARPQAMAAAYREVQVYMRQHGRRSRCVETDRPGPFILPHASAAHEHGLWLRRGDAHFEPR
jgi:hypothetical protein